MLQDTTRVAGVIPFDWKQELFERLDVVGQKAGVVGEAIWAALVRQQVVEFFIQVGHVVAWTVAVVVVSRLAKAARARSEEKYGNAFGHNDPSTGFFLTMAQVVLMVSLFVSMMFLATRIGGLMNPEYYAFKQLLELIRGSAQTLR